MDDERDDIVEWRWWSLDELERSREEAEPEDLVALGRHGLATLARPAD
jgi:hypothetical protein